MSSAQRRRSSASGAPVLAAVSPSPSSSSSSVTAAVSRRARPSASVAASSRRRRLVQQNRCRNPFCGAALKNKKQRYCDGSKFCQLRRGFALLCAWPNGPESEDADEVDDDADDAPLARSRAGSSASATTRRESTSSATTVRIQAQTQAPTSAVREKRPRGAMAVEPPAAKVDQASAKKPRVLQRRANADNVMTASATAMAPPLSTTTTTAQQVKTAAIEVVPLGVGSRAGGGGRYVSSGNRTGSSANLAVVRSPSFPRFQGSSGAGTPTTTSSTDASLPPQSAAPIAAAGSAPVMSSAASASTSVLPKPAPTSRALSRTTSLPVTTRNRSRDPRVRAAAAAANGDAAAGGVKRISAADYLSNRNKDGPDTSYTPTPVVPSLPSSSSRVPEYRPLNGPTSLLNATPPGSDLRSSSNDSASNERFLQRSHSDTTRPRPHDFSRNDQNMPLSVSSRGTDEWNRPRSSDHGYDHHHHGQGYSSTHHYNDTYGSTAYAGSTQRSREHGDYGKTDFYDRSSPRDRPPLSRGSSSSSMNLRTESDTTRPPSRDTEMSRSAQIAGPTVSRAESLFGALLRPKFSYRESFLKLVISRMASFLPTELHAVSNETTKPRKLSWYLEYAKRVEDCCGALVKLTNDGDVARLTIAGREWMAIEGKSTMKLYHQILERLLRESERWRALVEELTSIHAKEMRTRPGGAINGVSFLKLWSAIKNRNAKEASDLDIQSNFTDGANRRHQSFIIGNVEIGSGSGVDTIDAFKDATSSAYAFLAGLTILPLSDKKNVATVDESLGSRNGRRSSPARSSPRANGGSGSTTPRASAASSSARSSASPRGSSSARNSSSSTSSITSTTTTSTATVATTRPATATFAAAPAQASRPSSVVPSAPVSAPNAVPVVARSVLAAQAIDKLPTPEMLRETQRQRSGSLNGTSGLSAAFSSMVPLERSASASDDEGDHMSISSCDGGTLSSAAQPTTAKSSAATSTADPIPSVAPPSDQVNVPALVSAPAPAPPSCRFCAEMQASKPGAMCLRCVRAVPKRSSIRTTAKPVADLNRSVEALQSFIRQSTSLYLSAAQSSTTTTATGGPATVSLPSSTTSTPQSTTG